MNKLAFVITEKIDTELGHVSKATTEAHSIFAKHCKNYSFLDYTQNPSKVENEIYRDYFELLEKSFDSTCTHPFVKEMRSKFSDEEIAFL